MRPVLFVFSGFAALVYQVLWVRELGLLVGSTAQAAALAIAIFFAGVASGNWFWGRRAKSVASPLALFGWLEIGVGIAALAHFGLIDVYHGIYPRLFAAVTHHSALDLFLKAMVAATILFPASFLMGGTLPAMGEDMVRKPSDLARKGSFLYALNTFGGAAGALSAGFILPLRLGFRNAYLLAVGIDVAVGISALLLTRWRVNKDTNRETAIKETSVSALETQGSPLSPGIVLTAFTSGFCALGVEIIWTRLFAQVLQNSVYTYALVLVTFLLALSLGAGLAHGFCRIRRVRPETLLPVLLTLAGLSVVASPWLFHYFTGGLGYIGAGRDWWPYLYSVLRVIALVVLPPAILLEAVLPYLLRFLSSELRTPGRLLGSLMAVDTTGAIIGALIAGFVIIPRLGASRGLIVLGGVYLLAAGLHWLACPGRFSRGFALATLCLAAAAWWLPADGLRIVAVNTARHEQLIEVIEGPQATVALIMRDDHLLIRVNNYYTLGGSGASESERNQALIPMMLHPSPRRVFFLGMGTGITAGAALAFPVEKVVVCEILPEVIGLAKRHFGPWTQGLFDDPRVQIVADDGRNHLRRHSARYDLIISDLFTPWKAGTGNLYTLEHYQTAAQRLNPDGMFVQWIPAYQVSDIEFGVIAATMDKVFDQVVVWRGDLRPAQSIIALVGYVQGQALDLQVPVRHGRALALSPEVPDDILEAVILRFYAGNITASRLFTDRPVNTDNRPLIEYVAPRTQRKVQAGHARWLTGDQLGILYARLAHVPGWDSDPYLARLNARQIGYVMAGQSYIYYAIYRQAGLAGRARLFLDDFIDRTPFDRPPPDPDPSRTPTLWEEPTGL